MFKALLQKIRPQQISSVNLDKKYTNYHDYYPDTANNTIPQANYTSYNKNVIVHRCVNLIAQSVSHVPWTVYHTAQNARIKLDNHPAYELLNNPTKNKGGAEFFEQIISNKLLFGNAFILAVGPEHGVVKELHSLSPIDVDCVFVDGELTGYRYNRKTVNVFYPINFLNQECNILHLKTYSPIDKFYGRSSLEAASLAVELHNKAVRWNYALLQNGARPSGALIVKDNSGFMTEQQYERLKQQLYDNYQGSANSGKPMLLEGGLDWRDMSISPKDMDFMESKNSAAREIALAFGVPPQLLGISGDNTYSNMQEARLALWEETLIPLLDSLADSLTNFLSSQYREKLIIKFDKDAISALAERRQNIWAKLEQASFITDDEKRAFIGLPSRANM